MLISSGVSSSLNVLGGSAFCEAYDSGFALTSDAALDLDQ